MKCVLHVLRATNLGMLAMSNIRNLMRQKARLLPASYQVSALIRSSIHPVLSHLAITDPGKYQKHGGEA